MVSSADLPLRISSSPFGPYVTLAKLCVATAPTPASAHGTTAPTARNFDATATPHSFASGSYPTTENVATTSGSGVGLSDGRATAASDTRNERSNAASVRRNMGGSSLWDRPLACQTFDRPAALSHKDSRTHHFFSIIETICTASFRCTL